MVAVRIESVDNPLASPEAGLAASILLARADAMGLLNEYNTITRLDVRLIEDVLQQLARAGLAQSTIICASANGLPQDPVRMVEFLTRVNAVLEDSPIPEREWPAVRAALGDELLSFLSGISEVSLRRYASGARTTPDPVAYRLHVLALIVADLRGAYNEYGIRRWFQRPRPQLGGRTPAQWLPANWTPDNPEVSTLRSLAGALSGSPAT